MKVSKISILLTSALFVLSACNSSTGSKKDKSQASTSVEPTPSVDPRNVPYENTYPDYDKHYAGYAINEKLGLQLKDEMHTYFIREHKTYITYGNFWFYGNTASDLIPGTEKNELFYTGKEASRVDRTGIDREHVWACSKSNGLWVRYSATSDVPEEHNIDSKHEDKYWGAGSDLYHIRPASGTSINQKRSDASFYDYDEAEIPSLIQEGKVRRLSDGGKYVCYVDTNTNKFEVADEFKGDVARILMYLWVHYSSGTENVYYSPNHTPVYDIKDAITEAGHSPYVCGSLSFSSIMAYDEIECYNKLVEWNQIDPPSAVEINRNNYVETVQGNRNPFVDYPQLVERILFE